MDRVSEKVRSKIMSRINGDSLKPETITENALRFLRYSVFIRNCEDLPGRPDFALTDKGIAIFVHGCFWHGCSKHYKRPKSNWRFWKQKLETNQRRDARVIRQLNRLGWSVITVWEHDTLGGHRHLANLLSSRIRRVVGK